jgi:hypothetical protein
MMSSWCSTHGTLNDALTLLARNSYGKNQMIDPGIDWIIN